MAAAKRSQVCVLINNILETLYNRDIFVYVRDTIS